MRTLLICCLASALPALAYQVPAHPNLESLKSMPGFKIYLPKGQIAAIFKPEFVAAKAANLPDDAWVIGVSDGTNAKAYSINLLNRHEIVNDFIGDKPIATTW